MWPISFDKSSDAATLLPPGRVRDIDIIGFAQEHRADNRDRNSDWIPEDAALSLAVTDSANHA